jgi:hypothetical protein
MENYEEEEYLNTTPSPIKRPQYCDLSVVWNGRRDEKVYTYKPIKSEFSVKKPPFGLDKEITDLPDDEVATGYRRGGPKEARLFRVALLAAKKEVDGLHPVRVSNIPEDLTEEQLAEEFSKYGAIGDIYIPRDLKRMTARNFAILRFEKEEAAKKALESRTATLKEIKAKSACEKCGKTGHWAGDAECQPKVANYSVQGADAIAHKEVVPLAWYASDKTLRSGCAFGQAYLQDGIAALEAKVGTGKLFVYGPEITFRGQTHSNYKMLFNQLYQ